VDAFSYLFGSIIAVNRADVWAAAALTAITIGTIPRQWGKWAYATFDSELAEADGINLKRDNYSLSILIALTVVVSIKIVGIILIAAFLVIPAAAARLFTDRFSLMTFWSIAIGVVSSATGLWLAYVVDVPAGATIILFMAVVFIVSIIVNKIKN
jgi:zinc transport system permease protein